MLLLVISTHLAMYFETVVAFVSKYSEGAFRLVIAKYLQLNLNSSVGDLAVMASTLVGQFRDNQRPD